MTATFSRRLLKWYDKHQRSLPWRGQTDPYRIWISEAMLQQTVVATVIPYYRRFLNAFPTVEHLADAPESDVMHAWAGLGYYSRARSLKQAAAVIMERFGGQLPNSETLLRTLPGVGPYTAAAVAAIAYGRRAFALDGNAARVMARVHGYTGYLEDRSTKEALHTFGLALVPDVRSGDFAQAVMELGARICVPRAPKCIDCPVAGSCVAFATGQTGTLPMRRPKRPKRDVNMVCVAAEHRSRLLFEQRPSPGLLAGTWTLPSDEAELPLDAEATARRVLARVGISAARVVVLPGRVRHVFTHLDVQATVVWTQVAASIAPQAHRWVKTAQTCDLALASYTRKLLAHFEAGQASATKDSS